MPRFRRRTRRKGGLKKLIKKMIAKAVETKTYGYTLDTAISTTGVNYDISSNTQGIDQNDRIGNVYTLTSFRYKACYFHNQASVDNSQLVRVVLYLPKNVDDLISTGTAVTDAIDQDRYNILSDRLVPFSRNGQPARLFHLFKPFNRGMRKGMHIRFSGPAATDFEQNRLMLYMVSTSGADTPSVKGWWRAYFKDA